MTEPPATPDPAVTDTAPQAPVVVLAPPANPFVPVVKEPWFNPNKKTSVIVSAIVAAILLLGIGFCVGARVAHRHDRARVVQQFNRGGPGFGYGRLPGNGGAGFQRPGGVNRVNGGTDQGPGNQGGTNQGGAPVPPNAASTAPSPN